ncbi:MAG: response regulator transcription factor [Bacteroidia bacterium]|nr:response regulator transcription factor [Bacteroidia bacterium]
MKILLVDDEHNAREFLEKKLAPFKSKIESIAHADGVQDAIKKLTEQEFDLMFLDIRMPDGTGFDLLAALPDMETMVVFCTAFDEFAVKAFEFAAMGYLLKPVDEEQLELVMHRVEEKFQSAPGQYKLLVESYRERKVRKIVIPNASGFLISEIGDVVYVKSDGNYSEFHFNNGEPTIVSSKTLKEYQNILSGEGFFRIHQTYLINLAHVKEYKRTYSEVVMLGGATLPVARQKRTSFQEVFF